MTHLKRFENSEEAEKVLREWAGGYHALFDERDKQAERIAELERAAILHKNAVEK